MRKVIGFFLALLLIGSLVIGCSTQSPTTATSTASTPKTTTTSSSQGTTATSATTTAKPTPSIKTGGTMKVLIAKPAIAFGYPPSISGVDGDYTTPFWNRLVRFDDGSVLNPDLASKWDIAPDSKSITFTLRQGVKFHDGTDFNAAAVKSNFDLVIPPNPVLLTGVDSVQVIDPYTVKLNISKAPSVMLYQLAVSYQGFIASPTAVQKNGKDWAMVHAVGTGPFMQKDYVVNTSMSFVKNPNYWDKGLPYLDGIEISTITDAMTQLTMFKAGQTNVMYDVIYTTAAQLRDSGYNILNTPGALYMITFDTKSAGAIFANPKVREAFEYAIDKDAICNGPGMGFYKPAYQVVKSNSPAYNPALPQRKYDPAKAKKLLAEAGYPNGFEFTGTFQNTTWIDGITAVQKYLADVGIKMNMNVITNAALAIITRQQDTLDKNTSVQMQLNSYSSEVYNFSYQWRTTFPQFKFVQKPAGLDAIIDRAENAKTEAEANKILQEATKLLYDDSTAVPLWLNPRLVATDKYIQDPGYFINGEANNNKLGWTSWINK